jgi:polysaccharide biosynthesis protein PslG
VNRILGLVLASFVAITCLSAPATAAAPASRIHVSPDFFGIHDSSGLAYDHLSFGALRIWDAGAAWKDIETSPGTYDWSRVDTLVRAAQAHHVEVTLVLGMTPSVYATDKSEPPADLGRFAAYVRAAMARYRDFEGRRGIESYQVWNEGNVSTFWTGTPQQLAQLTAVVGRARNAVDPGATVVAPSFAARLPAQQRWISAYQQQRVDGHHVWHFYDVNALSLYPRETYGDRIGGPEDAIAILGQVQHRLARAGVPHDEPLWATEVNYGLPSGQPGQLSARPISDRRQVANVLRTYLLGAARGLSRVYWYRYDWGRVAGGGTLGNTMLTDPDDHSLLTPAGRAVLTVQRWMNGRLVSAPGQRRACSRDRLGTYTCLVRHGDRLRTILWNPHHRVRVQVRGATTSEDQNGRPTTLRSGTDTLQVGFRPVMVETVR